MGAVILRCLPFPKSIPRVGRKFRMKQSLKQLVLKLQRSGIEWPKGMSGLNSHLASRNYFWLTCMGNWPSTDVCVSKRSSASRLGETHLGEASATHCARWQYRSLAVSTDVDPSVLHTRTGLLHNRYQKATQCLEKGLRTSRLSRGMLTPLQKKSTCHGVCLHGIFGKCHLLLSKQYKGPHFFYLKNS